MNQEKKEVNYQPGNNVFIWWLISLACLGIGGGVIAPLTTDDLMLDIGYGILVAKIVHGFILGIMLGIAISSLALGCRAVWVSARHYIPGLAAIGAFLICGALMLGADQLLETAPTSVAGSFEKMAHDMAAIPVHVLILVIAALATEALTFVWHRSRHHEQQ